MIIFRVYVFFFFKFYLHGPFPLDITNMTSLYLCAQSVNKSNYTVKLFPNENHIWIKTPENDHFQGVHIFFSNFICVVHFL